MVTRLLHVGCQRIRIQMYFQLDSNCIVLPCIHMCNDITVITNLIKRLNETFLYMSL